VADAHRHPGAAELRRGAYEARVLTAAGDEEDAEGDAEAAVVRALQGSTLYRNAVREALVDAQESADLTLRLVDFDDVAALHRVVFSAPELSANALSVLAENVVEIIINSFVHRGPLGFFKVVDRVAYIQQKSNPILIQQINTVIARIPLNSPTVIKHHRCAFINLLDFLALLT